MIWLPFGNFYKVHAAVLDRPGQYGLYITKDGLEDPNSDLVIPDILVRTYLTGDQHKFAYWNTAYWSFHEKISPEISDSNRPGNDFVWSRFIVVYAREHLSKINKNISDAYGELVTADPLR